MMCLSVAGIVTCEIVAMKCFQWNYSFLPSQRLLSVVKTLAGSARNTYSVGVGIGLSRFSPCDSYPSSVRERSLARSGAYQESGQSSRATSPATIMSILMVARPPQDSLDGGPATLTLRDVAHASHSTPSVLQVSLMTARAVTLFSSSTTRLPRQPLWLSQRFPGSRNNLIRWLRSPSEAKGRGKVPSGTRIALEGLVGSANAISCGSPSVDTWSKGFPDDDGRGSGFNSDGIKCCLS